MLPRAEAKILADNYRDIQTRGQATGLNVKKVSSDHRVTCLLIKL